LCGCKCKPVCDEETPLTGPKYYPTEYDDKAGSVRGRACIVQWVSTPAFLTAAAVVAYLRLEPIKSGVKAFDDRPVDESIWACDLHDVVAVACCMLAVEAIGQTPLALASWFSDIDPSWQEEFVDEFLRVRKDGYMDWNANTGVNVIVASFAASFAFFVMMPALRWVLFAWAMAAQEIAFMVGAAMAGAAFVAWLYTLITWRFPSCQKTLVLINFFASPLACGVSLIVRALLGDHKAWDHNNTGLLILGVANILYVLNFVASSGIGYHRWIAELVNAGTFFILAIGAGFIYGVRAWYPGKYALLA